MEKHSTLELLLETSLRHVRHAEEDHYHFLQTLIDHASSLSLRDIFLAHRVDTERQMKRLDEIFSALEININHPVLEGIKGFADKSKELFKSLLDFNFNDRSKGMLGIINEGKELVRHFSGEIGGDVALVNVALQGEAFEASSYKSLLYLGELTGRKDLMNTLKESLEEELSMEKRLSDFAFNELKDKIEKALSINS